MGGFRCHAHGLHCPMVFKSDQLERCHQHVSSAAPNRASNGKPARLQRSAHETSRNLGAPTAGQKAVELEFNGMYRGVSTFNIELRRVLHLGVSTFWRLALWAFCHANNGDWRFGVLGLALGRFELAVLACLVRNLLKWRVGVLDLPRRVGNCNALAPQMG